MTDTPILELETSLCLASEDNRPAARPGNNSLVEGIRVERPACAGAGMPAPRLARQIPDPRRGGPLVRLRQAGPPVPGHAAACPGAGYRADPAAAPAQRHPPQHDDGRNRRRRGPVMSLKECTQEEAAGNCPVFGHDLQSDDGKTAHTRRAEADGGGLRPSIVAMIAPLPTPKRCGKRSSTPLRPGRNGKLPTRDQIAAFIEPLEKEDAGTAGPGPSRRDRGPQAGVRPCCLTNRPNP